MKLDVLHKSDRNNEWNFSALHFNFIHKFTDRIRKKNWSKQFVRVDCYYYFNNSSK